LNKEELLLSKKLIKAYKEKLEKEIVNTSKRLKIPPSIVQKNLNNNEEMIQLENALEEIERMPILNSEQKG
tara:strand:+ start:1415 stop:1627 length:213 start_codon:yes stop_codon:yes gene_type:complete